ncbi:SGNH/GDSL hydrolase family protein [Puniceicoccaceae bacterium K14]|nr:SGNH/GDSL hydrolase family protein [Puniceicoccaceae bacterium K14]
MKLTIPLIATILALLSTSCMAENRKAVPHTSRNGLANTFEKLEAGESVRIGYLGGSITKQEGWRVLTQSWIQASYPQSQHVEIEAGVGGTPSALGAFRVQQDVLQYAPDLIFIEFAVNDANTAKQSLRESMEGIVRQIRKADPRTDICFVYSISEPYLDQTQGGTLLANAANAMEEVADYYGIPSIYMGYEIPILAESGSLLMKAAKPTTEEQLNNLAGKILFAPDGVHPYPDTGHPLYFKQIRRALPVFFKASPIGEHPLPAPLEANNFEDAKMIPLSKLTLEGKWQRLDPSDNSIAKKVSDRIDELWCASSPKDYLSFAFKGTYIGVYGIAAPNSGTFDYTIDGTTRSKTMFDKYCSFARLNSSILSTNLQDTTHTIHINPSNTLPNKESIMAEGKSFSDFKENPEKYEQHNLYLNALLIRGELIENEK